MYIEEAKGAVISGDIPVNGSKKAKSTYLDKITGETPLIFNEIGLFFKLAGNSPLIF